MDTIDFLLNDDVVDPLDSLKLRLMEFNMDEFASESEKDDYKPIDMSVILL